MTVDTIFLCFCEDIVENDGGSRPYYMSTEFMNVMKMLKDEVGGDFNLNTNQTNSACQVDTQVRNSSVNRSAFHSNSAK